MNKGFKTVLVGINAKYIHTNIAIRYLKEYASDFNVDIVESNINVPREKIFNEIIEKNPDVVGFSCYIFNIDIVKKLVIDLKKVLPHVVIMLGGAEVSYENRNLLDLCDYILEGEGEECFVTLLSSLEKGEKCDKIIKCEKPINLDNLPFIYTKEYLAEVGDRTIYYESSRGCPFSCSYCLSSINKGVRFKSSKKVEEELNWLIASNVREVKFVDRTFNCNLEHAKNVLKIILNAKNNRTHFHFEIGADIYDDEFLDMLSRLPKGIVEFEIGLQSFNEETLEASCRKTDMTKVCEFVKNVIAMHNIHTHVDLIAGLPYEFFDVFKNSFNKAMELQPHYLQLGFLKMLKGSKIKNESGLFDYIYSDNPPYEVFSNKFISYKELCELKNVEEAVSKFYNDCGFRNSMRCLMRFFDTSFDLYYALGFFLKENGYLNIGLSKLLKYQVLIEFAQKIKVDINMFINVLRFDYMLTSKTQSLCKYLFVEYSDKVKQFNNRNKSKAMLECDVNPLTFKNDNSTIVFHFENIDPITNVCEFSFV